MKVVLETTQELEPILLNVSCVCELTHLTALRLFPARTQRVKKLGALLGLFELMIDSPKDRLGSIGA